MTLRQKTIVIILGTLALLMVSFYVITRFVLVRNFEVLESNVARAEIKSVSGMYQWYQSRMLRNLKDWAEWDETYNYIKEQDAAYIDSNFVRDTYVNNDIDFVAIYDKEGQMVFGQIYDRENQRLLPLGAEGMQMLRQELREHGNRIPRGGIGVNRYGSRLALLAMNPVRKNNGEGDEVGSMFMGKFLDQALGSAFSRIQNRRITFYNTLESPTAFALATSMKKRDQAWLLDPSASDALLGRILLVNHEKEPTGFLIVELDRPVKKIAEPTTAALLALFLGAGACFGVGTFWLLNTQVLRRLQAMTRETHSIAQGQDISLRLDIKGQDELATLAGSINMMLSSLSAAEQERMRMEQRLEQGRRLQAIGTLASGVAHEINNPLNSLLLRMGTLEMQLEDGATPSPETLLARVRSLKTDIERIGEIVRHMRSLVRAQSSGQSVTEAVNLMAVLDATQALIGSQLDQQGVRLELHVPGLLPPAQAVARELELVLVNLISNALQAFSAAGTVEPVICIRLAQEAEGIVLYVEDNGPGLGNTPEEVFDPFFTTKSEEESMGMGLAIVLNMITGWDARIEAGDSALGGARFRMTLQVAEDTNEDSGS